MKILFLARHYTYFRNFESVLRELAARGHSVHLAVEFEHPWLGGREMVEALAQRFPNVTYGEAPSRDPESDWAWVASRLRLGVDYLRYQHRLFDDAPALRERARYRAPGGFVALGRLAAVPGVRPLAAATIRALERAIPEEPSIRSYLEAQRPDVLLITPLVDLGSSQIDFLRSARSLGIPTGVCVWSWDHLSSKALIREWPDRLFVWNRTQQREAETLHDVPPSRVVVTGAQCFDQWFDRSPSRDRAAFCAAVGLPADRPIVLYVCSALFAGSPPEAEFVARWLAALRNGMSEELRNCSVLVRPHPSRLAEWQGVDLAAFPPVAIWGGNPVTVQARHDYFDSLYHASAVVGLNTSAFIEAAIVGRPVYTVLVPEFAENQMGTVHFRYLRDVGGGLLNCADDFDAHVRQLDDAVRGRAQGATDFVREFVRPFGLDVAATPRFVEAVEALPHAVSAVPQLPQPHALWTALGRSMVKGRHRPALRRLLYAEREQEKVAHVEERERIRAARVAAKATRLAEQEARRAEERQRHAAAKAQKKAAKEEARRQYKQAAVAARRAAKANRG